MVTEFVFSRAEYDADPQFVLDCTDRGIRVVVVEPDGERSMTFDVFETLSEDEDGDTMHDRIRPTPGRLLEAIRLNDSQTGTRCGTDLLQWEMLVEMKRVLPRLFEARTIDPTVAQEALAA